MSRPESTGSISRRSLLKSALLSSGAVMVPGVLTGANRSITSGNKARRIGLLLPKDDLASRTGEQIEAALNRRLSSWRRESGEKGTLLPTVTSSDPSAVRDTLERLIHDQGADQILCYQSNLVARTIAEVASSLRRPITLLNGGAHGLDAGCASNWLDIRTLDLFGRNRARAAQAAERGFRRAVILTSLNEAWYSTAEAFRQGFEGRGGIVERIIVADPVSGGADVSAQLREESPDVLFQLGHAERDGAFTSELTRLAASANVPVVRNVSVSTGEFSELIAEAVEGMFAGTTDEVGRSTPGSLYATAGQGAGGGVPVPYV